MEIIRSVQEMRGASAAMKREGRRVALVPTMGALHEGHGALIRQARASGAAVVVSIYVNPTQFGPHEDFKQYPRTLEADAEVCKREEVDAVFAPSDGEMYPGGQSGALAATTWVEETALTRRFEGDRRPGHFRGVCTVVAKLFNMVQPDIAVFGQKDYQQLKVVQRMARDLGYAIQIEPVPTVRESDGLAMSSRNRMLSATERAQAAVLWKALNVARDLFRDGEHAAHRLEAAMQRAVGLAPNARLDYAQIADGETLEPVAKVQAGCVALIAAHLGKVRLIDNLIL
ncbi:MAG TPA: pantoate--beta-alanine ligase [Verrucomicrobiae bacterium]|nr:pantoate--beta-alanine ligase [Verrucomicrobiae bacterium]